TVNGLGASVTPSPAWNTAATGTPVTLSVSSVGTIPTGLSTSTQYYILNNTTGAITLSTSQNGSGVTGISGGTGTFYITTGMLAVTSIASNTITMPASHGWANGTC